MVNSATNAGRGPRWEHKNMRFCPVFHVVLRCSMLQSTAFCGVIRGKFQPRLRLMMRTIPITAAYNTPATAQMIQPLWGCPLPLGP